MKQSKNFQYPLNIWDAAHNNNNDFFSKIVSDPTNFNLLDINLCNEFFLTPLHISSSHNFISIAKLLIFLQADLNIKDAENGWTALHKSIYNGSLSIASLLLKANCNINLHDNEGFSAFDLIKKPSLYSLNSFSKIDYILSMGYTHYYNLGYIVGSSINLQKTPRMIKDLQDIKGLACSNNNTVCWTTTGELYLWGTGFELDDSHFKLSFQKSNQSIIVPYLSTLSVQDADISSNFLVGLSKSRPFFLQNSLFPSISFNNICKLHFKFVSCDDNAIYLVEKHGQVYMAGYYLDHDKTRFYSQPILMSELAQIDVSFIKSSVNHIVVVNKEGFVYQRSLTSRFFRQIHLHLPFRSSKVVAIAIDVSNKYSIAIGLEGHVFLWSYDTDVALSYGSHINPLWNYNKYGDRIIGGCVSNDSLVVYTLEGKVFIHGQWSKDFQTEGPLWPLYQPSLSLLSSKEDIPSFQQLSGCQRIVNTKCSSYSLFLIQRVLYPPRPINKTSFISNENQHNHKPYEIMNQGNNLDTDIENGIKNNKNIIFPTLRGLCEEIIIYYIDIFNAIDLLSLSTCLDSYILQNYSLDFVNANLPLLSLSLLRSHYDVVNFFEKYYRKHHGYTDHPISYHIPHELLQSINSDDPSLIPSTDTSPNTHHTLLFDPLTSFKNLNLDLLSSLSSLLKAKNTIRNEKEPENHVHIKEMEPISHDIQNPQKITEHPKENNIDEKNNFSNNYISFSQILKEQEMLDQGQLIKPKILTSPCSRSAISAFALSFNFPVFISDKKFKNKSPVESNYPSLSLPTYWSTNHNQNKQNKKVSLSSIMQEQKEKDIEKDSFSRYPDYFDKYSYSHWPLTPPKPSGKNSFIDIQEEQIAESQENFKSSLPQFHPSNIKFFTNHSLNVLKSKPDTPLHQNQSPKESKKYLHHFKTKKEKNSLHKNQNFNKLLSSQSSVQYQWKPKQ